VTVCFTGFGTTVSAADPLEWTACDDINTHDGFSLPIHCILCDGLTFEFFKFENWHAAPFLRGCFVGDPEHLRRGLRLPDFTNDPTSLPFILQLRRICETVFDVMLCAYISGLEAHHKQSKGRGEREGSKRPSLDKWDQALAFAQDALKTFREAESQRSRGDVASANASVQEALRALQKRYYLQSSSCSIVS